MVLGGGVFSKWLDDKGGALINAITALIKGESFLAPPPCEETAKRWQSMNQDVVFD